MIYLYYQNGVYTRAFSCLRAAERYFHKVECPGNKGRPMCCQELRGPNGSSWQYYYVDTPEITSPVYAHPAFSIVQVRVS